MKPFFIFLLFQANQATAQAFSFTQQDGDSLINLAKQNKFSGALLVMKGADLKLGYTNGWANERTKAPNTLQTRFNVGSIGKTLTAILIMQLVEQKKLALDHVLSTYLPAGTAVPNSNKITIRQLLNHTSGLGDFFESPLYNAATTRTTDDHLKLIAVMKPVCDTPGKQFRYSNSGFIVLGKLLETIYKKPYQQIVEERILHPARISKAAALYCTGYVPVFDKLDEGDSNDWSYWTAAGGIFLSPLELQQIMFALMQGKYLKPESRKLLWTASSHQEGEPPFVNYGLGWITETPGGVHLYGHDGGVPGFEVMFRYLPDEDLYLYAFSNRSHGAGRLFMQLIFFMLNKKGLHL